jgi:hypothetical protein
MRTLSWLLPGFTTPSVSAGRVLTWPCACCALHCVVLLQVGDALDIEILRGNSKEHVTAVLEPNA